MTLEQLPDNFTPQQFMQLDRESLDRVPFDVARWQCKIKLCKHCTFVRDYHLPHPFETWYYHTQFKWVNSAQTFFICHKHKKYKNRPWYDMPLKSSVHKPAHHGGIIWGGDNTGKIYIIY